MNDVTQLLQSHRSIRAFIDKTVPQALVEDLILCGQGAATSSFIQTTTVIQVTDSDKLDRLMAIGGDQKYIKEAPVFLVFCADMNRHQQACEMHDAPMLSGYTEQFLTASIDAALFAQNVVVAAEAQELGICYIGALRNDPQAVSDVLGLPDLVYPVFGLCIGYPDQNPEVKPRLPVSVVLKQNSYQSDNISTVKDYDERVRHYYATRSGNPKSQSWSEQISGMLQKEARPHMLPFLKKRGFLLK